jgi:hypothetical protein
VRRILLATVVFVTVVAGATAGVVALLDRDEAEPEMVRCTAALDGTDWHLEPDQAETAALLAGTALRRGLPARALTIAIATGLQESKLRNVTHGDRDSVGIFQQRPSQGWGTTEQILDPVFATNAFYDALLRVDGYQDLPITDAAQAVQRSGFPEAYAQHESWARAWASAMYGYSSAAVTCTLPAPDGPADPQAVVVRAQRDLGLAAVPGEAGVLVDTAPLAVGGPEEVGRLGWAVAHWGVSVAGPLGVTQIRVAGSQWDRDAGAWATVEGDPLPDGQVLLTLAG